MACAVFRSAESIFAFDSVSILETAFEEASLTRRISRCASDAFLDARSASCLEALALASASSASFLAAAATARAF